MKWKIEPACDNVHVELESFDIEEDYDFLVIGDYNFTGRMKNEKSFFLQSGFEIKFESDESDNADRFKINWNCPCELFTSSILITRNQFFIYSNKENLSEYSMFQILKIYVLGTIWFFTKIIISRHTT